MTNTLQVGYLYHYKIEVNHIAVNEDEISFYSTAGIT